MNQLHKINSVIEVSKSDLNHIRGLLAKGYMPYNQSTLEFLKANFEYGAWIN